MLSINYNNSFRRMLLLASLIIATGLVSKGSALMAICTSNKYYCPSDKTCHPRNYRCTPVECCHYPISDSCFKNHSLPGAYVIVMGRMKRSRLWILRSLVQKVVLFRGLLYEHRSKDTYATIHDINDPYYRYGIFHNNEWVVKSKGIRIKGSSFCSWEHTLLFVQAWNKLHCKRKKFTRAITLFLTTGVCALSELDVKRYREFNNAISTANHARNVTDKFCRR